MWNICIMRLINWSKEKNTWLKENRGVSFEDILYYIDNDFLIDDIEHANQEKYPGQRVMVLDIKGYIHLIPYIETENQIFLKTIIPSRKAMKKYLGESK